ncbi:serine protease [Hymenobacter amundsenii]|uniref:Serine protease n=1 Tax=Hymenobacter amundsenii TaxID=2006685 RepID=A0A246FK82_9BACT|nr:S8 family peptidase [Hymenobacter amundsenii]OWP62975.1 serine protease [Hymenobacter amundsenii]
MALSLLRKWAFFGWMLPLCAASLTPARAQAPAAPVAASTRTVRPGQLVIKLKADPNQQRRPGPVGLPTALTATLSRLGMAAQPKFPQATAPNPARPNGVDLGLIYEVTLPAATPAAEARQALLKTGLVEYAEPLYDYQPLQLPNDPLADSARADGQYHLRNIRAYQAWDVSQGDTSIVIGIADGGTRFSHEDLKGQNQLNRRDQIDGLDNDGDGYVDNYYGWDFADNDNDPDRRNDRLVHGILVAGCASGTVNNGLGIAGVGYKCRYLPLKIYASTPTGSFGGYEAIVYAADHGCQVINLSWGGPGSPSRFEQDVISYAAINHDVVVIAAAGNTPANLDFYPASYEHVLSVAWTTRTDERDPFATYSRRVDLSAPGAQVLTTYGLTDSDYIAVGGSSFAAPLVAGVAGLVRSRFPNYNAAQVRAQLKRTTDNIDALPGNVNYAGFLGSGRLNAFRALTENVRSASVIRSTFAPARAAYAPADTIRLTVEVQNLLLPLDNLRVTLTSLSPYLIVRQAEFAAGPLATLEQRTNAATPYRLAVAATVPVNTRATLRYHLQDAATGYEEDQYETVLLNPDYVVLDANNLTLTLTSRGNIGYDGLGSSVGVGVSYRQGPPLLSEGGLLVATSATRVSDNVRNDQRGANADFAAIGQVHCLPRPPRADQEAEGVLRDQLPTAAMARAVGVQVRQHAYAWAAAPHQNYVVLEYRLTNLTTDTLRPLHVGLFMDWDLPGAPERNIATWDAARRLGYVYGATAPEVFAGVQLLAGGTASVYSLDNSSPLSAPVRLSDGFSTAEKWLSLSSGTAYQEAGRPNGSDVSQVVGAVLPRLAPADSATVAFAVLAAPTLPELQAAADAARTRYEQVLPVSPAAARAGISLYPNPTTGLVNLTLPRGPVRVRVLSVLGQELATYHFQQPTGLLDLSAYPAGLYLVRVEHAAGMATYRLLRQP